MKRFKSATSIELSCKTRCSSVMVNETRFFFITSSITQHLFEARSRYKPSFYFLQQFIHSNNFITSYYVKNMTPSSSSAGGWTKHKRTQIRVEETPTLNFFFCGCVTNGSRFPTPAHYYRVLHNTFNALLIARDHQLQSLFGFSPNYGPAIQQHQNKSAIKKKTKKNKDL